MYSAYVQSRAMSVHTEQDGKLYTQCGAVTSSTCSCDHGVCLLHEPPEPNVQSLLRTSGRANDQLHRADQKVHSMVWCLTVSELLQVLCSLCV